MDNLREEIMLSVQDIQSAIDALKDAKVVVQELKKDHKELEDKLQNALRLLARTEEERRIAVAQVAHFKEVLETRRSID